MTSERTSRTLLCATDFSETASLAVSQAAALAAKHGAKLVLAHAIEPLPADSYPMPMSARIEEGEVRDRIGVRLEALAEPLRSERVAVETVVEVGSPGRVLVDLASRLRADLLLIGTRGLTGLKHLLLGSTAETVVRRAPCPVLTIHPEDRPSIPDARVVLVPTDLSEDAMAAVDAFTGLFHRGEPPQVELVYVDATPPYLESMTHERLARRGQEDVRLGELLEQMAPMAERIEALGLGVSTRVLDGRPVEAIAAYVEAHEVDLVVMSTHGRSAIVNALLGRTAQRIVQHVPCPVLTICPKARRRADAAAKGEGDPGA